MNEFTKGTGPIPGGPIPSGLGDYQIVLTFAKTGQIKSVIGPQGMPMSAIVNHLAVGIQVTSVEMMRREQEKESRIVVPKILDIKPIGGR